MGRGGVARKAVREEAMVDLRAVVRTGRLEEGGLDGEEFRAAKRMAARRETAVKYVSSGPVSLSGVWGAWRKSIRELCSLARDSVR